MGRGAGVAVRKDVPGISDGGGRAADPQALRINLTKIEQDPHGENKQDVYGKEDLNIGRMCPSNGQESIML